MVKKKNIPIKVLFFISRKYCSEEIKIPKDYLEDRRHERTKEL